MMPSDQEKISKISKAWVKSSADIGTSEDLHTSKIREAIEAAHLERFRMETAHIDKDHTHRRSFAEGIFNFVKEYMVWLFIITIITSIFSRSIQPVLALIGATAVNAIGLLAAVIRYLFPQRK